ncbi:MAG TPA: sigma-54 dependent transcriptional regulator [Polyangiales bacterium]
MPAHILIVDDDREILLAFSRMLGNEQHQVETASSAQQALDQLERASFDLVITDLSMPQMDGLDMLMRMRQRGDATPTLVISGAGSIEHAVRAIKLGAIDFIEKPLHRERLMLTVQNALRFAQLQEVHSRLQADVSGVRSLVGDGPAMQRLRALIAKVGPSEGRVLITGENGTGKELVAAAIHAGSARGSAPFVKLNCGAVPKELVESELFGHEKGAFTGAVAARKGRFELADGGTLLLDEIGDMPMPMQVKLLRVLQEGQFERVGAGRTTTVDVRVLAATNRDLGAMVSDGTFREDLYYRLNVVTLHVPALRARKEDLPVLVAHFTSQGRKGYGLRLSPSALQELSNYDFPGNIRELENLIERLAILYPNEVIEAQTMREVLSIPVSGKPVARGSVYQSGKTLRELLHDLERQIMLEAIAAQGNSKGAAAQALGAERSHFYKKCRQYGIGDEGD